MSHEAHANQQLLLDTQGNVADVVPNCPIPPLTHFHNQDVCENKPVRLNKGSIERKSIYEGLRDSGMGATMVPNQQTVVCPVNVESLESDTAIRGLDTTWIAENTSSRTVIVSWVVEGVEWSPYRPDILAVDDPQAYVKPGEWLNVPTFDSFIYHAREIDDDGNVGQIVLQHRVGLIAIGNPNGLHCDLSKPDVEPVDPKTAEVIKDFSRPPTPEVRKCNTVDLSFRNQAGCPLHVYWASGIDKVPETGFACGEKFRFHLGTKPAPQDFMNDWESSTKFEGSFIGHTFVARLASDPKIVVDSYTVETTKIIDCPNLKQSTTIRSKANAQAEVVMTSDGVVRPSHQQIGPDNNERDTIIDVAATSFH